MLAVLHAIAKSIPAELLPGAKTSEPVQNLRTGQQRPVPWSASFNN